MDYKNLIEIFFFDTKQNNLKSIILFNLSLSLLIYKVNNYIYFNQLIRMSINRISKNILIKKIFKIILSLLLKMLIIRP